MCNCHPCGFGHYASLEKLYETEHAAHIARAKKAESMEAEAAEYWRIDTRNLQSKLDRAEKRADEAVTRALTAEARFVNEERNASEAMARISTICNQYKGWR
jgi:hypothetical protein